MRERECSWPAVGELLQQGQDELDHGVPGVLVLKSLNLEHLDILSYKLYLVCPRLLVYTVNSRGHGKGRKDE